MSASRSPRFTFSGSRRTMPTDGTIPGAACPATISTVRRDPPRRAPNSARRPREYLTHSEGEQLIPPARRRGRHGVRDAAMMLIAYRHGLPASELTALRWSQVDLVRGALRLYGAPGCADRVHSMSGSELSALRALQAERHPVYVFATERERAMTPAGFRKLLARCGIAAGLGFPVHPQMLRHACRVRLSSEGAGSAAIRDYLGLRNGGR
jgi:type 1 fimbriae regulatory protein FimE